MNYKRKKNRNLCEEPSSEVLWLALKFCWFFFDNSIIRLEIFLLKSYRDRSVSSTVTIANQSILESCATSQNHSKFDIHADGQIWNRSAKSSRFLPQNSIEKFWIPNFSSRPLNLKNDQFVENVSGQEKSESLLKKSCTVSHWRFYILNPTGILGLYTVFPTRLGAS